MPLSDKDKDLLDRMLGYLKLSQDSGFREKNPSIKEGVGLAAPQVGVNKTMLVIYYPSGDESKKIIQYELVNPKIVVGSVKKCYIESGEGCLSVDKPHPGNVFRDYRITVKAYNALSGKNETIKARGFDAIVLQHEIDHLSGILFYDHIDKVNPFRMIEGAVAI